MFSEFSNRTRLFFSKFLLNMITDVEIEEDSIKLSALKSVGSCFLLSVLYVSSLYIWSTEYNRDHPTTIKRRFFSVFLVMLISPVFVYYFSCDKIYERYPIWEIMGFRVEGILPAISVPLLLTAVLFLGPLCVQIMNGVWRIYTDPLFWYHTVQNLMWLRNHVVAPLSEEFTFRACMLPLLLQTFKPMTAVLITPLFFGVAHLHHMKERLKSGMELKTALLVSLFQFFYTTIFGAYSAYLFMRTGHFIAPFLAHAFCNHMGFPDFQEVLTQQGPKKGIFIGLYLIGLVGWIVLLPILTEPSWYSNNLFWIS